MLDEFLPCRFVPHLRPRQEGRKEDEAMPTTSGSEIGRRRGRIREAAEASLAPRDGEAEREESQLFFPGNGTDRLLFSLSRPSSVDLPPPCFVVLARLFPSDSPFGPDTLRSDPSLRLFLSPFPTSATRAEETVTSPNIKRPSVAR